MTDTFYFKIQKCDLLKKKKFLLILFQWKIYCLKLILTPKKYSKKKRIKNLKMCLNEINF